MYTNSTNINRGERMKKKAIICDIDGCLLKTGHIINEAEEKGLKDSEKWAYFQRKANDIYEVEFNFNLGDLLEALNKQGYKIILSTARSSEIRSQTIRRLKLHLSCDFELYMRDYDDVAPAPKVKKKHLKEIQKKYEVYLAIDDEDKNLDMFSSNGLYVMKSI